MQSTDYIQNGRLILLAVVVILLGCFGLAGLIVLRLSSDAIALLLGILVCALLGVPIALFVLATLRYRSAPPGRPSLRKLHQLAQEQGYTLQVEGNVAFLMDGQEVKGRCLLVG